MCPPCRDSFNSPEAVAQRETQKVIATAHEIDGAPWWRCGRGQVVVQYSDFARLESETPIAQEHGWEIGQTDTSDGHVNIGRIVALGGLSLLTPLRSKGMITVTWQRAAVSGGTDPVTALRQLKELLELQLVTQTEYDAKKAEILARL